MVRSRRDPPRGLIQRDAQPPPFSLERYHAEGPLAELVDCYWITRWDLPAPGSHRQEILAHPCLQLVVTGEGSGVFGIGRERAVRELTGRGRAFGIKFRPGAFRAVCSRAAAEFTGKRVPLDELFGAAGAAYEREVEALDQDDELVRRADRFVQTLDPALDETGRAARDIVEAIERTPEIVKVDHLVERFGWPKRSLQRLFHDYVGVGPKWVIQRYRLHEAVARIEASPTPDFVALAQSLNYFDQAHFIRDFTRFVGRSPARYARETRPD